MPALTEAEKRERQQKSLGAAFLAHQVSQLEKSVDSLSLDRSRELYDPKAGSRSRARPPAPGAGPGAAGSSRSSRAAAGGASASAGVDGRDRAKAVRVLDASVLVHALPLVKLWVREDQSKLIVPLAVISTLDQLKHAPQALHEQARLATAFLDAQFTIARQIKASSAPGTEPPTIRLRPQSQAEEVDWAIASSLFSVPAGFEIDYPAELVAIWSEEAERALAAGEEPRLFPQAEPELIPKELRSTIQSTLYFNNKSKAGTPTIGPASLVVYQALPSPASPSTILFPPPSQHEQQRRLATSTELDFLTLSSGDRVATVLDTFFSTQGVPIERVGRGEVERARDWFRDQARAAQAARDRTPDTRHPKPVKPAAPSRPTSSKGRDKQPPATASQLTAAAAPKGSAPTAPPASELDKDKPRRSGRSRGRAGGGASRGEGKPNGLEKGAHASVKRTNSSGKPRPASGTLFVP